MAMVSRLLTVAAVMLLSVVPVEVIGQTVLPTNSQSLPAEIQALLRKDPQTLTDKERTELIPFIRPGIAPVFAAPEGTVNCFDYYRFGSVQVDVTPSVSTIASGSSVRFFGTIKNDNSYPIVDGQVYAKVFYKNQQEAVYTHQNGYALVDQFFVTEGVTLDAQQEKPIEFSWRVPGYAASGEYEVAMFFTSAKRFNLLGLSFTDDVVGNRAAFSVVGETNGSTIAFDKNAVHLNTTLFRFAAYPPHFAKDEPVTARATLINPGQESMAVTVSYDVYAWDGLRTENRKESKQETVTVEAGNTKELAYVVPETGSAVTYFVITATSRDTRSILDIRFVRDGIDETRINFPGLAHWPLKAGEANAMFSCLHSTNAPVVKGGSLMLTLKDARGRVLQDFSYTGDITGDMLGVKSEFVPKDDVGDVTLTATLKQGETVVDEVTQIYSCESINSAECSRSAVASEQQGASVVSGMIRFVIFGLTIFGIILVALVIWRRTERTHHTS